MKDGCTVREAQARYTLAEFMEWMAYDAIEPWSRAIEYADIMNAVAITGGLMPHAKKNTRIKPENFMVMKQKKRGSKPKVMNAKQLERAFMSFVGFQRSIGNLNEAK